ncbi:hypothetical protein BGZ83_000231 [Gryganskiella cystojenkinii]|nr:hypothetical protein BGZ83_000231 [Gryganskiella cystojenkinii]
MSNRHKHDSQGENHSLCSFLHQSTTVTDAPSESAECENEAKSQSPSDPLEFLPQESSLSNQQHTSDTQSLTKCPLAFESTASVGDMQPFVTNSSKDETTDDKKLEMGRQEGTVDSGFDDPAALECKNDNAGLFCDDERKILLPIDPGDFNFDELTGNLHRISCSKDQQTTTIKPRAAIPALAAATASTGVSVRTRACSTTISRGLPYCKNEVVLKSHSSVLDDYRSYKSCSGVLYEKPTSEAIYNLFPSIKRTANLIDTWEYPPGKCHNCAFKGTRGGYSGYEDGSCLLCSKNSVKTGSCISETIGVIAFDEVAAFLPRKILTHSEHDGVVEEGIVDEGTSSIRFGIEAPYPHPNHSPCCPTDILIMTALFAHGNLGSETPFKAEPSPLSELFKHSVEITPVLHPDELSQAGDDASIQSQQEEQSDESKSPRDDNDGENEGRRKETMTITDNVAKHQTECDAKDDNQIDTVAQIIAVRRQTGCAVSGETKAFTDRTNNLSKRLSAQSKVETESPGPEREEESDLPECESCGLETSCYCYICNRCLTSCCIHQVPKHTLFALLCSRKGKKPTAAKSSSTSTSKMTAAATVDQDRNGDDHSSGHGNDNGKSDGQQQPLQQENNRGYRRGSGIYSNVTVEAPGRCKSQFVLHHLE